MTAREELIDVLGQRFASEPDFLDALTPDLWLRYGLEMGWVEQSKFLTPSIGPESPWHVWFDFGDPSQEKPPDDWNALYRFTASVEKEEERT